MSSSAASGPPRSSQDSPRVLSSRSSSSSESRPSLNIKRSYSTKKESMNGPLYRQTVNRTVLVRRLKRKGDGPSKQLARWFVENQIGMVLPMMSSRCPLLCIHKFTLPFPSLIRMQHDALFHPKKPCQNYVAAPPDFQPPLHSMFLCSTTLCQPATANHFIANPAKPTSMLTFALCRLLLQPPRPPFLRPLPPPAVPGLHFQILYLAKL